MCDKLCKAKANGVLDLLPPQRRNEKGRARERLATSPCTPWAALGPIFFAPEAGSGGLPVR